MNVGAVSSSLRRIQSPSGASGPANTAVQNLQQKTPARAQTVDALDRAIGAMESARSLEMHYDKDIGMVVVQVLDGQTNTVICQIPPEEIVNSMKSFRNYLKAIKEGV